MKRTQSTVVGFENDRREAVSQGMQASSTSWKGKETDPTQNIQRGTKPFQHPDFSPVRHQSDFSPTALNIINLCCLKPVNLW